MQVKDRKLKNVEGKPQPHRVNNAIWTAATNDTELAVKD